MKTARFATVVAQCGQPEIYLALMDPKKDQKLQTAIKGQQVMTVWQESVGGRKDRGEVGFDAGSARQFLVFPKSLAAFAGCAIVGINYDLLGSPDQNEQATVPQKSQKPKPKRPKIEQPKIEPTVEVDVEIPAKVVAFTPEPPKEGDEEITDLKKQMRQAMALLEEGKAVAAYNLLKKTVEN